MQVQVTVCHAIYVKTTDAFIGKKSEKQKTSMVVISGWCYLKRFLFSSFYFGYFPNFIQWACATFKTRNDAILKNLQRFHNLLWNGLNNNNTNEDQS